jgi:hypothetical protein
MDNKQISQGAHASAPSAFNRRLRLARTFVLASLMAVSLVPLQSAASADQSFRANKFSRTHEIGQFVRCSECAQILNQCLANGGGGSCYADYSDCLGSCEIGR